MGISFNSIPAGWKLPLVYIEVDPSQAGTPVQNKYALLAGQMTSAGSADSNIPYAVGNLARAKDLFGAGSMLAAMYAKFFALNRSTPVVCIAVDDPIVATDSGVKASGTITVSHVASQDGVFALYIAGQKLAITVLSTDSTANIATKINTAINAAVDLPVVSTVLSSVVTLTCKWKGANGNDISMLDNFLGSNGAETMPVDMVVAYSGSGFLTAGSGVPDWSSAIAALGDEPYEYVAMPYTDTGSVLAWDTEYGFTDSGRWGWLRESYGHVFSSKRGTYGALFSYGPTNNSGVVSILAFATGAPSPVWEWAAAYTARAAGALNNDPARPLQSLTLNGLKDAPRNTRFSKTELNGLAGVGLAVASTDVTGVPVIAREQTTYQLNTYGQPDNAYELVTTLATLAALFRRLKAAITNKYPRHKLANDGTRFGPGQAIVTPNIIRAELVSEYRTAEFDGLVENGAAFKAALVVERDDTDPNRVNVLYPPDLVNQLRLFAVLAQFRLQFPTIDQTAA